MYEASKSVMQAVAVEAVDTVVTHAVEIVVEEVAAVVGIEEVLQAHARVEEILVHVMVFQEKAADTKATVTAQLQAETVEIQEILVPHALQVAIEVRAEILLLKKAQAQEHPALHAQMLQEHQEVIPQKLLVVKVLQAALPKRHPETLTKKTNL